MGGVVPFGWRERGVGYFEAGELADQGFAGGEQATFPVAILEQYVALGIEPADGKVPEVGANGGVDQLAHGGEAVLGSYVVRDDLAADVGGPQHKETAFGAPDEILFEHWGRHDFARCP